jgi:hypothetical protein
MPLHLVLLLYIINSVEVEVAGVSPFQYPVYLAPDFCMFGLLSVVFSGISHCPPVRFIGQAPVGCKTGGLEPTSIYFAPYRQQE